LPVARVGSLLRYTPNTGFQHRAHIRGIVTLFWPGRLLCVQDGSRGLCAQTEQSSALNIGDGVDVIGFPVIGEFTPTLLHAVFLRRAVGQPVPALPTSAEQALSGNHDAQAVAIDGQLIGENEGTEDPTLVFSSGNFIFSAVLPRQSRTSALDSLEVGSRVRILGVCSVQSDGAPSASGAGFTVAKSFRILLRSSGDVVVLQRPSWWNAEHTLRVLAVALAITLVALGGVVVLQQRVRLQSKVIHAQLVETAALKDAAEAAHKAAEFQATHDGLTGVLNRTAIFELLHREFELASRSGATTGVMMIDLDHFKRINDRFGHLTGDEVLKQAVTRVRDSVRSSDLVGRYGGEEFLIVLPHCDKLQIQTCAERIRLAISSLPIIADGNSLSVTTSVGATVAILPFHSEQEALSAADMALYHAKNNGRNRVVLFDLESRRVTEPTQAIAQATSQHA
jgi:diguanylate cyclase (GGDEF)-like protein